MSKRDKFLLVLPLAGLFIIAVALLVTSHIKRQAFEGPSPQAFEKFVTELKSRRVAPEEWIRYVRAAHSDAQACRANALEVIDLLRISVWSGVAITVVGTFLVFTVTAKYKESAEKPSIVS